MKMIEKLADRFLKLESVLTLTANYIFYRMCMDGRISAEMFMTVFLGIVGTYFVVHKIPKVKKELEQKGVTNENH